MAYSNGNIEKPVSIRDLQQCFGISSNDLGTLIKTIGEDEIINKWARYKPQRDDGKILYHGSGWTGLHTRQGSFFGLNIPFCTTDIMNGLIHEILIDRGGTAAQESWSYLYPRGKAVTSGTNQHGDEYYRLTDFVRTPNDSSDTTPAALKGYNHNANIPFKVSLDMTGVTEIYSSTDHRSYYQVNRQVTNTLTFNFTNSVGNDIHLQDLVDINGTYVNNCKWRPVVQAFKESRISPYWWERGSISASNDDIEVAGDPITSSNTSTISINLNAAPFNKSGMEYEYFHICVGVGCCNPNYNNNFVYKDNNNSLFIVPFDYEDLAQERDPFHYIIRVVSAKTNNIKVTEIQWTNQSSWTTVSGSNTFEVGVAAADLLRLKMTFYNTESQSYVFKGQTGTYSDNPRTMKVRTRVFYNGSIQGNPIWLTPTNSSWNPQETSIANTESTKTLYATLSSLTNSMPAGSYYTYYLEACTNNNEEYGTLGTFTIYKRTTA